MHTHQVWGACGDCFEDGGGLALAMGSMVVMIMVGLRSRCGRSRLRSAVRSCYSGERDDGDESW